MYAHPARLTDQRSAFSTARSASRIGCSFLSAFKAGLIVTGIVVIYRRIWHSGNVTSVKPLSAPNCSKSQAKATECYKKFTIAQRCVLASRLYTSKYVVKFM